MTQDNKMPERIYAYDYGDKIKFVYGGVRITGDTEYLRADLVLTAKVSETMQLGMTDENSNVQWPNKIKLNEQCRITGGIFERVYVPEHIVTDEAKRDALEWFEDLVTCSKLVSGQEPQARYIRAGILSGFYEVPSFGVDYLFNNTCSGLSLFDSKDGGDSKTTESHVRARFLQLLNWIAYNYPKGIKVVK